MSADINVISQTQRIIVDSASGTISIINAGPVGPTGPEGPEGPAGTGGTVDISGTPVVGDYAKWTDADTIEGRSFIEVQGDLDYPIVLAGAGVPSGNPGTAGDIFIDASGLNAYIATNNSDPSDWQQINGAGSGTVDTSGTPAALDFARFTDLDTIEGRSPVEALGDLGAVAVAGDTMIGNLEIEHDDGPSLFLIDSNAAADAKRYRIQSTEGWLYITQQNDNESNKKTPLYIKTDGSIVMTSSPEVTVPAPTVDLSAATKLFVETAIAAPQDINAETASFTFALTDAGELTKVTSASDVVGTVPPNSSVAFPLGTQLDVVGRGTGLVTIAEGAGVTINVPSGMTLALAGQYAYASLKKIATDEWDMVGLLGGGVQKDIIEIACSDETTVIDATGTKVTLRMQGAGTIDDIRGSLTDSSATLIIVDAHKNGTTIMTTDKLEIDGGDLTSVGATTAPTITSASYADDDKIEIILDDEGDGTSKGLKVYLHVTRSL